MRHLALATLVLMLPAPSSAEEWTCPIDEGALSERLACNRAKFDVEWEQRELEPLIAEQLRAEDEAREEAVRAEQERAEQLAACLGGSAAWHIVRAGIGAELMVGAPDESGNIIYAFLYKASGVEIAEVNDGYTALTWTVNPEAERAAREQEARESEAAREATLADLQRQIDALEAERQTLLNGESPIEPLPVLVTPLSEPAPSEAAEPVTTTENPTP